MMNTAIIIGFIILGVCLIGCSFVLSGAITGAAAALKSADTQTLQQPTMKFLTEFDAADYLGLSLNELDYMRSEGLLDNTFIAVTSLEQTGEEEYPSSEDGMSVTKVRPVVSSVTRFLYNAQLLDQRMLELIEEGKHINPNRKRQNQQEKPAEKPMPSVKPKEKAAKKEPLEKPAKKDVSEKPEVTVPSKLSSFAEDTLSEFEDDEQALIAAAEAEYIDDELDMIEEEIPSAKPVKKNPDNQNRQGGNRPSGQGPKNKQGKKGSGKGPRPQQPKKSSSYIEDDSDMKIIGSKKSTVTVYSDKGSSSNPSSPVYSTSDDDEEITVIKPAKPAQKSLSKPRIAVISSDVDDDDIM